jgi:hypothetical protein
MPTNPFVASSRVSSLKDRGLGHDLIAPAQVVGVASKGATFRFPWTCIANFFAWHDHFVGRT